MVFSRAKAPAQCFGSLYEKAKSLWSMRMPGYSIVVGQYDSLLRHDERPFWLQIQDPIVSIWK